MGKIRSWVNNRLFYVGNDKPLETKMWGFVLLAISLWLFVFLSFF